MNDTPIPAGRVRGTPPLLRAYPDRGLVFSHGKGPYLYTDSGRKYLDLMSNYGVSLFGYGHPALVSALSGQLPRLTTLHGSFGCSLRNKAAAALLERCGGGLETLFFSSSGSEAVEAALKFAAAATGKRRFVACRGGYHGKTMGALAATHSPKYRGFFAAFPWDVRHVEYGDPAELEAALDEQTAAFIVEPIQGEAGVRVPPPGYIREARKLCAARGVLLILDEVQTGAGRTGRFLASEEDGGPFDLVCLGKGLAGGIPVGVTLLSGAVAAKIPRGLHTSTFGGNPLAAAGILAVLDLLDAPRLARIRELGETFRRRLLGACGDLAPDVRGRGLMLAVEVTDSPTAVLKEFQRRGFLAAPAGSSSIRLLPPCVLEENHVNEAAAALRLVLERSGAGPERGRPCAAS
jgi:acetylornithine/succinyldiaminopimelate/putrescine aminotransferase